MGIHFPDGQIPDVSLAYHGHLPTIIHNDSGRVAVTGKITNQRAELTAIYHGIQLVHDYVARRADGADGNLAERRRIEIHIYTDSEYCINSLTNWCYTWKSNDWRTSNGKPVKNRDIIEETLKLMRKIRVVFFHAEAHTNMTDERSLGNARADFLATSATRQNLVPARKK
jgi:ribonuclease HI